MNDVPNAPNKEKTEKETIWLSTKMVESTVSPVDTQLPQQFIGNAVIKPGKWTIVQDLEAADWYEPFLKPIKTGLKNTSPKKKLLGTSRIRNPYEDTYFPMEDIGKEEPF